MRRESRHHIEPLPIFDLQRELVFVMSTNCCLPLSFLPSFFSYCCVTSTESDAASYSSSTLATTSTAASSGNLRRGASVLSWYEDASNANEHVHEVVEPNDTLLFSNCRNPIKTNQCRSHHRRNALLLNKTKQNTQIEDRGLLDVAPLLAIAYFSVSTV